MPGRLYINPRPKAEICQYGPRARSVHTTTSVSYHLPVSRLTKYTKYRAQNISVSHFSTTIGDTALLHWCRDPELVMSFGYSQEGLHLVTTVPLEPYNTTGGDITAAEWNYHRHGNCTCWELLALVSTLKYRYSEVVDRLCPYHR